MTQHPIQSDPRKRIEYSPVRLPAVATVYFSQLQNQERP